MDNNIYVLHAYTRTMVTAAWKTDISPCYLYIQRQCVYKTLPPPPPKKKNDSNCQHKEHVVFLSSSAVDCRERSERLMPFPLIGTEYTHDG